MIVISVTESAVTSFVGIIKKEKILSLQPKNLLVRNVFAMESSSLPTAMEKLSNDFANRIKLETASRTYKKGYTCSQAVFAAFAEELGLDEETAYRLMHRLYFCFHKHP